MKFVLSGIFFCWLVFFSFSGCSSKIKQSVSKTDVTTSAEVIVPTKTEGSTVTITPSTSAVSAEEIAQTKTDLEKITLSHNYITWYSGFPTFAISFKLPNFGDDGRLVIQSPYFWIAFWNGYEQHKNKTDSNKLDEVAIKKIFQKSKDIPITEINTNKKGLKAFVESILAFADVAASSDSLSTTQKAELSDAVTELTKGTGATNAVTHLENLILHSLWYSINKKLESSHVFVQSASGEFYFKNGVFTETGINKGFGVNNELTKLASESIRGLTILKGSIDQTMIPTLSGGKLNVTKATNDKNNHINRIDNFVTFLKTTFNVTTTFTVYTGTLPTSATYTSVLTSEEIASINTTGTNFVIDNPFVLPNKILEVKESSFLIKITSTTDATTLIPLLISTSLI